MHVLVTGVKLKCYVFVIPFASDFMVRSDIVYINPVTRYTSTAEIQSRIGIDLI